MSAVIAGGITRAYSKAVRIGDPRTIAAEDYDIKSDYEAVHGKHLKKDDFKKAS